VIAQFLVEEQIKTGLLALFFQLEISPKRAILKVDNS